MDLSVHQDASKVVCSQSVRDNRRYQSYKCLEIVAEGALEGKCASSVAYVTCRARRWIPLHKGGAGRFAALSLRDDISLAKPIANWRNSFVQARGRV